MKKINTLLVALIAALAMASMAQSQAQQGQSGQAQQQPRQVQPQQGQPGQAGQADRMGQAGQAGMQQDQDKMFIQGLASGNQFEIQAGEWAQENARDDEVKKFAQMMVQEHQAAREQIQQVAQRLGVSQTDQLNEVHRAQLQHMQKMPAEMAGRKYIFHEVGDHQTALLELTYQSMNARSPEVKQLAQTLIPKYREHLEHANQIAATETARTAGERQQPADMDRGGAGGMDRGSGMDRDRSGTGGASGTGTGAGSGTGAGGGRANPSGPDRGTGGGAGTGGPGSGGTGTGTGAGSGTGGGTTDR